ESGAEATPRIVGGLLDFLLALDCDRSLHLFTREEGASSHCQMGGLTSAHAVIFRWLEHALGEKPLDGERDPRAADRVVATFGKFGGREAATRARTLLDTTRLV